MSNVIITGFILGIEILTLNQFLLPLHQLPQLTIQRVGTVFQFANVEKLPLSVW